MILGLDISTTCTGWSIIDCSGSLVAQGFIPLSNLDNLFKKAGKVQQELTEIHKSNSITTVAIEENLQAFRPGLSSARTLLTLARFNGIVSYICENVFGVQPSFINVNTARKSLGLKIIKKSKGGAPAKEQVMEWVSSEIPEYPWPVKTLKSGPRKGLEILSPGCYDTADAYVIARAYVEMNKQALSM